MMLKLHLYVILFAAGFNGLMAFTCVSDSTHGTREKMKALTNAANTYLDSVLAIREQIPYELGSLAGVESSIKNHIDAINLLNDRIRKVGNYETETIGNTYLKARNHLREIRSLFETARLSLEIYLDIEKENDRLRGEYHNHWNETYYRKKRVENLFIKIDTIHHYYGSAKGVQKVTIRKKNIYEPGMLAYDEYEWKLRNLKQCDFRNRISHLKQMQALLIRLEELLYLNNTRELEKSLRKETDIEVILSRLFES